MTTESPDPNPQTSGAPSDRPSIGAMVAEAREAADLSIAEVSERTRIRKTVIDFMEHDDFSHCGGDIYAKGHLRAIGTAVGADASGWVAEYNVSGRPRRRLPGVRDRDIPASPNPPRGQLERDHGARPRRRRRFGGRADHHVVGRPKARADEQCADPNPTPTDNPSSEPTDDSNQVAEAEPDQVVVRITVLPGQRSWVSVTRSDGTLAWEGTLESAQSRTFRDDKKLSVVAGCASGVELTVNGQNIGTPGATCGIQSVNFTPKDPDGAAG